VFCEPKLPKTRSKLIIGATTMVKRDITPTNAQFTYSCQSARYSYTSPYPWSQLCSCCCQVELRPWESPPCGRGTSARSYTSAIVLFDSGASHSFISATYDGKHNLPLALLRCQIIVSSPGGDMPARQLCPKVNLQIRGVG
jgi:hypothetical protein